MLDVKVLQRLALQNEKIAEKRFKKLGLRVERLDYQGPRKRPEFLVWEDAGPLLVCEVRTIFSGGYRADRGAHISTEDPALLDTGVFARDITFEKIEEDLAAAVAKYRALLEDRPQLAGLPLVVVFFIDFFANDFDLYPRDMPTFPEISGIMRVELSHEIRRAAEGLSLEELAKRIESGSMEGMPPPSKTFRVVPNTTAKNPLPQHFLDRCIT